ncbi:hypothetical protein C2S51_001872 [Perilla frutescens var. frutescens]|nr:hypothetical protein C2S51_001872 [Perilla frutescens var. frutescens]
MLLFFKIFSKFTVYSNHVGYTAYTEQVEAIADAAHAVEDVIESHIVDRILADGKDLSSTEFYEAMQKVIDGMELVKREIMDMRENMGVESSTSVAPSTSASTSVASSSSASVGQNQTMVGFDDILLEVLDKLTSKKCSRQIISISGMVGIGKTTLARNVYEHELVVQHFDFLAWLTISQEFNFGKIIRKVLKENGENLWQVDENDLVWDGLKLFLPDNNNGSRIMITTRLSNLAHQIDDSHNIVLDFLDEDNSWKLFCNHVFGKDDSLLELKEIGMNIVRGCKGLPLSISVVGGLLAKSKRTQQYWEHVEENLNSIVNLEDKEHCLQILYMSYNSLPLHLKLCFLSIGCSRDEDEEVPIMFDISVWIGEGFVRPIHGKSLEESAKEYITELIDRNLILVNNKEDKFGGAAAYWMFKSCSIHDLLRDLCLREAENLKFVNNTRRVRIARITPEEKVLPILKSASLVRSLMWQPLKETSSSSFGLRLLRVAVVNYLEDIFSLVNMRLIVIKQKPNLLRIPPSISRFWNLQTLVIDNESPNLVIAPIEIWNIPQLRLILVNGLCLPDPPPSPSPSGETADCSMVMENLHTLAQLHNFKCSEQVVKRIPHIISYVEVEGSSSTLDDYSLNNLGRLQQLEHLAISVEMESQTVVQNHLTITFPRSLKTLTLSGTGLRWDDVSTKIGSLPLLQHLMLDKDSCIGDKWETVEGKFYSLEYLLIKQCGDLEYWMSETTHFPHLQSLTPEGLHKLNEIPSSIGDIPTLQIILVLDCSDSVYDSAETIRAEQEELGNEDLHVFLADVSDGSDESDDGETENED